LDVRIDDTWFDLSGWRKAHPAGEHWIDYYDGRDATEVMHAFHSEKARKMFQRLPKSKEAAQLDHSAAPVTSVMRNFRALRAKLEADGWWKRDIGHEVRLLSIWLALNVAGVLGVHQPTLWARAAGIVALAAANTQAGWLAHDYIHGVDTWSNRLRMMGPLFGGMSVTWWSDKHNKHHALTNEIGVDEDIATDPVLYIKPPNASQDSWLRRVQHVLAPLTLSALFWIWRIDSIKVVLKELRKNKPRKGTATEGLLLAAHWAMVGILVPLKFIPIVIFLSGMITAVIVTATHQSEELFENFNPDFVDNQFRTTRDAKPRTTISAWLWGGMQYQLEHHLFPSMPRSKHPKLQPILAKFAEDNQIPGGLRITDEFDLIKLNWDMYRAVANAPVDPTAPPMRGRNHHVSAIPA